MSQYGITTVFSMHVDVSVIASNSFCRENALAHTHGPMEECVGATDLLHKVLTSYRVGDIFLLTGDWQNGEKREAFYMLITFP